ncbi:hypothetical protein Hanom_Chr13g01193411 [Helianthus anomalus]
MNCFVYDTTYQTIWYTVPRTELAFRMNLPRFVPNFRNTWTVYPFSFRVPERNAIYVTMIRSTLVRCL